MKRKESVDFLKRWFVKKILLDENILRKENMVSLTVQRRRNKTKSSSVLRWVTPMNNGLVARLDLNIPEEGKVI